MRLVYIRTFHLKKYYFGVLIFTTALILAGINSVMAVNRTVPATSWAVANRVFVVDPGHGGIDPGAVGYQGLREKDIVLQVGQRLRKLLNQAGSKVIMTRESDIDLSSPDTGGPSARKVEDLSKRVELANNNGADLFLSIHVNAFPSSRWRGAQIFYQRNDDESKKLAEAIQSELTRIMGNTTRAAKAADYFTTRNAKIAAVIIEIGFISNPAEAELLKEPAYQRKLAYAIYSGLVKYYTEGISGPASGR